MITKKTPEEIELLREGGKRLGTIIEKLSKLIKPGVSTDVFEDEARRLIKEYGDIPSFLNYTPESAKRPFPAALCVCLNDEIVHGIPNEDPKILKEGDIITLDLGLTHEGLITDHARTFAVGEISAEAKRLLQVTREALQSGIKEARVGNRVGDISAAIERQAIHAGLTVIEGLSGHGVGYKIHEDPYVPNEGRKGTGDVLEAGMVLAIEPMFSPGDGRISLDKKDGYTYKTSDGTLSAQFEHTVVITEKGPEILTRF